MKNKQAIIEIKDMKKTYRMGEQLVHALRSISLDIYKGEYVALMGPSGSGKSTLMNMIGCLDTPSGGSYILNGNDVSTMSDDELAEIRNIEIGFVFQTFNLIPRLSALENVALPLVYAGMGKSKRIARAKEVLDSVGLRDRMHHRPNELSGGQCQRVAVARALVNTPSLILADEPTGNLDSKTSIEIMALFEEIHKAGNTMVVVTHEPDIAEHMGRVVKLIDGVVSSDEINLSPINAQERFLQLKALKGGA